MSSKVSAWPREQPGYVSEAPEGCVELSILPMVLYLDIICAVTWDALQGSSTAGRKTKMYWIIRVWVIHQGNAFCVRWR